jgi:hypothetical protein
MSESPLRGLEWLSAVISRQRRKLSRSRQIDPVDLANLRTFLRPAPERRDREIATMDIALLDRIWRAYELYCSQTYSAPLDWDTVARMLARRKPGVYLEAEYARGSLDH